MKPRLLFSELSGCVYVATRYTEKPHPALPGRAIIIAHTKYDVTEDMRELLSIRGIKKKLAAPDCAPPKKEPSMSDQPTTEHGRELAALPANWDSYGAKPLDVRAIVAAERFIEERDLTKCPRIVPLNGGGVQVEWFDDEDRECEIEFSPDGTPHGVYVEGRSEQ